MNWRVVLIISPSQNNPFSEWLGANEQKTKRKNAGKKCQAQSRLGCGLIPKLIPKLRFKLKLKQSFSYR